MFNDKTETTVTIDDKKTAAAKKREKETPRRAFTRPVRIPLTKEELSERGDLLAQEGDLIVSLEHQKAAETKRIGSEIAQAEGRAAVLRFTIRDKHETRPTECYEEWHDGEMLTRRCDTNEIVGRKPCPQRPLAIDEVPLGIDDTRVVDEDGNEKKKRKPRKR
jgi:hypothetical protein